MGRTIIQFELSNYADIIAVDEGRLTPDKIRKVMMSGVIDTGAAMLVLPKSVVDYLGLTLDSQATVRYADHRREVRDIVRNANVRIAGRGQMFHAIVEPNRTDALIGAIVLEGLDLIVDCKKQCVEPREPERILAEVE